MMGMEQTTITPLLPRPRLGLALAGGAARGFFHLGVVQALSEAGIRPDWYAGTSAGSLVAACCAAGLSTEAIRKLAGSMTWRRSILGIRQSAWEMLAALRAYAFRDAERMPPGFLENSRVARTIDAALGGRTFSQIAPLLVTSTDVVTGEEIVFCSPAVAQALADRGYPAPRPTSETAWEALYAPHHVVAPFEDVGLAVRCSTCIPGVMTTVLVDTPDRNGPLKRRLLNDGGIVDLVPVRPLRAAGCEKVLAVFLGLLPRSSDARHFPGVLANSGNGLASEQLHASLRAADHVIYDPEIERVSLVKLDPHLVDVGYEFTRARIPEIRRALGLDVVSAAA